VLASLAGFQVTVNGLIWVTAEGVKPNREVIVTLQALQQERDAPIETALELLSATTRVG